MSFRKPHKAHAGSRNAILAAMQVGDRRYVETTPEKYQATMRLENTPNTRRPPELEGRKFRTTLYTAVGAGKVGNIKYVICIERLK